MERLRRKDGSESLSLQASFALPSVDLLGGNLVFQAAAALFFAYFVVGMGIEGLSAAAFVGVCFEVGILTFSDFEALSAPAFDFSCCVVGILFSKKFEVSSCVVLSLCHRYVLPFDRGK